MNCRNLIQKIVLPVLLVLWSAAAFAQSQVTGRITDANGAGIAGVTVTVKGTNTATSTNENGQYTINVPASGRALVFSSVGYGTREESLNGRTSISTSLQTTGTNLNEVVVVAYGTRRRGDLTSAVSSVSAKDFQKGFVPSSEQLIQGKVSGVQITSGGGAAGGGSRIRIRGGASLNASNDPLIVIDGVPVEGNGIAGTGNLLSTINPNDIESISVLKDASAANLYGSRASNGVIIVTTKKGTRGKVRFNFNTTTSVQKVANYAPVLTGDQLRDLLGRDAGATGDSTWYKRLGTDNTNWQKEIYRQAFGSDNNLSASGQVGFLPFRVSAGYLFQEGVLKKNKFDRVSASLNLSPKFLNDHLSINVNGKFSNIKNNFSNQGAIGQAVYFDPTKPVYSGKGIFGGYYEWMQPGSSTDVIPLAPRNPLAAIQYTDNRSSVNRFIGNAQVDYKLHFFPDVHVIVNAGMDYTKGNGNNNVDSNYAGAYLSGGSKTAYKQALTNQMLDVQLTYSKDIKTINTKVDVMVGHTYQNFKYDNYTLPTFSYRAIADPSKPARKDTLSQPIQNPYVPASYAIESYIGRVNFNILDKYILQGSIRRDASSKLSPDNRIGYFPAVSAAWKVKEEFLRNVNVVSDLKLRGGWGKTGQQDAIDYYSYLVRYGVGENTASYQFGSTYYNFYYPRAYDKNIRWEETQTTNIGLDFGFFKGRVNGSIDLYKKKTKDLFVTTELAAGTNFANQFTKNIGDMEVNGWELVVNTNPVKTQDFSWDFNFNVAQNKRKITRLLEFDDPNYTGIDVSGTGIATGNTIGKHRVGFSPYYFYVYKQVYDVNGKPLEGVYEDRNRDGVVDENDRYFFKKPDADFLVGFSTQLNYKKWTLGGSAHGQIGNYVYNQYAAGAGILSSIKNPIGIVGNGSPYVLETGFQNNSNKQFLSDYYIQNGSFLRIDNINIGYNFGRVLNNRAGLRVSLNVNNVAVITNYKGMDPEVNNDQGINGNIYPRPRIYALGINLDF